MRHRARRHRRPDSWPLLAAAAVAATGVVLLLAPSAKADTPHIQTGVRTTYSDGYVLQGTDGWAAPYGGCDEVVQDGIVYVDTEGAGWCRAHGWTVRKRLVVGPNKWVKFSRLTECWQEDGGTGPFPCEWNFDHGKRWGLDYYATGTFDHHRVHYVHVGHGADVLV